MISSSSAPAGRNCLHRYDAPLGTSQGVRHVRNTLARWGLDGDREERATEAVLVAGELLANARQHGGGARSVDVLWCGTRLRIAVSDCSRARPRLLRPHIPARPSGHGLYLVERLAWRWGAFVQRSGKTVWAELRMPRRFGRPPPAPRAGAGAGARRACPRPWWSQALVGRQPW